MVFVQDGVTLIATYHVNVSSNYMNVTLKSINEINATNNLYNFYCIMFRPFKMNCRLFT